MNEITIAGVGTGSQEHLTPEVKNAINNSDVVVLSSRFLHLIPSDKKIIILDNFNETLKKIQNETGNILILVSGDVGLYSMLPLVKKFFADKNIKVLPGLSSLQVLCARAGEIWSDAKILSGHGRELNTGFFLNIIERNKITIVFCDKKISPTWIADKLKNFDNIELFVGSNLGNNNEIFIHGKAQEFLDKNFPELSIILIRNNDVYSFDKKYLRDCDFIREKDIVMTNENVRAVILEKLELNTKSLFWDIGAGSGSISVNAAIDNLSLEVHAIEKNTKAVDLIIKNAAKFHLHNIEFHDGIASKIIENLPDPTHIFIGGSGGEMEKIFNKITKFKTTVRVVIACVTLENFSQAYSLMKGQKNFEVTQISVTSSRAINGDLTLMKANNPVMILSADF
ncbi:MAG: precorrin-6y C5,15-methyltransferase (decarboxylating) subunit CbiE [Synergistaceae bacterium]|nr:precorrin-6y C5,15-methyltransferase (decarboxylating) subunit CbiE [Synergistaceae bacterium]